MAREFSKSFYNSKEWAKTRETILMRDKYLCVICGNPAEEVHHIKHLSPANIGDVSVTMNPSNLQSLCRDCHFEQHRGEHAQGRKASEVLTRYVFDENGMPVSPP